MGYQPFLIASAKTGLELGLEPWLLPPDAFSSMEDCFLDRGVITKRKGYSTFATCPSAGSIVGIFNRTKAEDGGNVLLAADVDYLFEYSSGSFAKVEHNTISPATDPVWTGDEDNLLHTVNWNGTVYMANGKDRVQYYDGSTFDHLEIDLTHEPGDPLYPVNEVSYCKFLMVHKQRLVMFGVYEDGAYRGQRARWCTAGNPAKWSDDEYLDAPTSEHIKGVTHLRDDILVFFDKSLWLLRYTGDSSLPFRWEKISSLDGSIAPFSAASFADQGFALGKSGFVRCDGLQAYKMDGKIPDYTQTFNLSALDRVCAVVIEEARQVWLAHSALGSDNNDRVLVYNYEEDNWSVFNAGFRCFGESATTSNLKWSDFSSTTWESYSESWVSGSVQIGYPTILAGGASGAIYRVNHMDSDAGSDISLTLMTGRWNPFKERGVKTRLGYVDFLVTCGDYEASVDFFMDMETSSYQTTTLDFNQDGEKAWVRIYSGCTSNFHRLKIRHEDSDQPLKIHAIMPWFAPAGRISQ